MVTRDCRKSKSSAIHRHSPRRRRVGTSTHRAKDGSVRSRLAAPSPAEAIRVHVIVVQGGSAGHVDSAMVAMNDNFPRGPSDARSQ